MTDHRIRVTDEDLAMIVAALRARRAGFRSPAGIHRIDRLASRLAESVRGNPKWILDEEGQTHEEDLDYDN